MFRPLAAAARTIAPSGALSSSSGRLQLSPATSALSGLQWAPPPKSRSSTARLSQWELMAIALPALVQNDVACSLSLTHRFERLVDLGQADASRDEEIERQPAREVHPGQARQFLKGTR